MGTSAMNAFFWSGASVEDVVARAAPEAPRLAAAEFTGVAEAEALFALEYRPDVWLDQEAVAVEENAIGKYSPCKREAPGIGVDPATILGVALEAEGVRDGDTRAGGVIFHKVRRCSLLIHSPNESPAGTADERQSCHPSICRSVNFIQELVGQHCRRDRDTDSGFTAGGDAIITDPGPMEPLTNGQRVELADASRRRTIDIN